MILVWEVPEKFGVPYFGILLINSEGPYYLGYYIRVPYFRKLPYMPQKPYSEGMPYFGVPVIMSHEPAISDLYRGPLGDSM